MHYDEVPNEAEVCEKVIWYVFAFVAIGPLKTMEKFTFRWRTFAQRAENLALWNKLKNNLHVPAKGSSLHFELSFLALYGIIDRPLCAEITVR